MTLSVVLVTQNEEANLARALASVKDIAGEVIVVDSGSTDRTREIAESFGAKVFLEPWKGYAAQKNSAIAKATGDWVLSLDADEEVSPELTAEIRALPEDAQAAPAHRYDGYWIPRRNYFLGRQLRYGGFWPDRKLRLFRRGAGYVPERAVHEVIEVTGNVGTLRHPIIHHSYPTLTDYIEHMNRYSSLGAEQAGPRGFSLVNIVLRPLATFIYNYFLRLGFLDGREGLLLHLYHALYVSWKYAKAWELSRRSSQPPGQAPEAR